MTQARGFDEGFAGAPLRAEHADVRKRELCASSMKRSQDTRILFETVRHEYGCIGAQHRKGLGTGPPPRSQNADQIGGREAALRGEVRTAVGDRNKPSQFARQSQQRFGIIAGTENPEARPGRAIVGPCAHRRSVDGYLSAPSIVQSEGVFGQFLQSRLSSCGRIAGIKIGLRRRNGECPHSDERTFKDCGD